MGYEPGTGNRARAGGELNQVINTLNIAVIAVVNYTGGNIVQL
jgi:hypothetical protein